MFALCQFLFFPDLWMVSCTRITLKRVGTINYPKESWNNYPKEGCNGGKFTLKRVGTIGENKEGNSWNNYPKEGCNDESENASQKGRRESQAKPWWERRKNRTQKRERMKAKASVKGYTLNRLRGKRGMTNSVGNKEPREGERHR